MLFTSFIRSNAFIRRSGMPQREVFTRPAGERVIFLRRKAAFTRTAGERNRFPQDRELSLALRPSASFSSRQELSLALRASESPFFVCAKKGNRKKHTPVVRSPGILPCDCASRLRGSLSAHPCAHNELARIVRATLRAFPSPPRRATGAPFGRHPAAEERSRAEQDQE